MYLIMSIAEFASEEHASLFADWPEPERSQVQQAREKWPAQGILRVAVDVDRGAVVPLVAGESLAVWAERDLMVSGPLEAVVSILIDGPAVLEQIGTAQSRYELIAPFEVLEDGLTNVREKAVSAKEPNGFGSGLAPCDCPSCTAERRKADADRREMN